MDNDKDGIILSNKEIRIMKGEVCPYCGNKTELIDSAEIYQGVSYGWMYICRPCDAYVGCYRGSKKALGRLANVELCKYKQQAHEALDQMWKKHLMKRKEVYTWLSQQLGTERDYTHIGMFNVEQCKRVISISEQYIDTSLKNIV